MQVAFTKMHGLGNDFVLLDGLARAIDLDAAKVRRLADRRLGVGCDQVLLLEPTELDGVAARYRVFNADGIEVGHCGNGARCVARYLKDRRHTRHDPIVIEALAGLIRLDCREDGSVRVDMGLPRLLPDEVPVLASAPAELYEIPLGTGKVRVAALSLGNPHAVLRVDAVATAPVAELGPAIATHALFPQGANVGFMEVLDAGRIHLRVFERGVGETPACGTGACAAVVAGRCQGLLGPAVDVGLPGGHLWIEWASQGQPIYMSGPATHAFDGHIEL
ncbi:MAG: diaminopimelate epimerase [Gammaproteobacteria bacterium]